MIQFVCDSCGKIKQSSDAWIVGRAAEAVGVTAARREVTIQSAWDRATALHPFAVHFCSLKCKDSYMAELFAPDSAAKERVKELLSGQVRQKSWLKEAAQSRASRREHERAKSIAPSGRLEQFLLVSTTADSSLS